MLWYNKMQKYDILAIKCPIEPSPVGKKRACGEREHNSLAFVWLSLHRKLLDETTTVNALSVDIVNQNYFVSCV